MISFTDNVVLSINDTRTLSTDVVYFDFSKAFDSVNHDLILDKLKNSYSIDGRLLKILKNYLCEREQSVVLDGVKSSSKPVLSGVPQGSILGPILFVLFINDLHEGISTDTHIALYADDTKLWRSIKNEEDITQLQRDINILYFWSLNNKMKFHPDKCKVVTIKPRTDFHYFTWGGVDKSWGGVICSLITGSLEFFPDIGLLARRNFTHTIQDLL